MKLIIFPITFIILFSYSLYAANQVRALYEVGENNLVLTTQQNMVKKTTIENQYVYSPYGIQRALKQPMKNRIEENANNNYQELTNQERKPLNIDQNQLGYTGQASDPSTSLMMLGGFRNYAPGIGRFIQPDTYNSFSKHHINNPNAYVKGNPVLFTDPTGHVWNFVINLLPYFNPFGAIRTTGRGILARVSDWTRSVLPLFVPGAETEVIAADLLRTEGGSEVIAGARAELLGIEDTRTEEAIANPTEERATTPEPPNTIAGLVQHGFIGADLSEINLEDGLRAALRGADLRGANFRGAALGEADPDGTPVPAEDRALLAATERSFNDHGGETFGRPENQKQELLFQAESRFKDAKIKTDGSDSCSICQEKMNAQDEELALPFNCRHAIHAECYRNMLNTMSRLTCPLCRANVA